MQDVPARRGPGGALSATHRAGAEAAAELIARSASAHTHRVYASALGQLRRSGRWACARGLHHGPRSAQPLPLALGGERQRPTTS